MVAADDVGALRSRLNALDIRKHGLEKEIEMLSTRLNSGPGAPGLHSSLVDREGFPRADVDVAAVRSDRQRVICLTNDHKALMKEVDAALVALHAAIREERQQAALHTSSPAPPAPPQPQAPQRSLADGPQQQTPGAPAFAEVDEIMEGSPAHAGGLRLGDRVCAFAGVTTGPAVLQRVAQALAAAEGKVLQVDILRAQQAMTVSLTPQKWEGRGLLGCHFKLLGMGDV